MYTDGSALGNPGPGGYGVLLMVPEAPDCQLQGGYRFTTNNRMELRAVIAGLEALPKKGMCVDIYTDSQYVVNAVEKKWLVNWVKKDFRKIKNPDLWKRYLQLAKLHTVQMRWVRGHSGHVENERCDVLAKEAADTPTQIDTVYEATMPQHT